MYSLAFMSHRVNAKFQLADVLAFSSACSLNFSASTMTSRPVSFARWMCDAVGAHVLGSRVSRVVPSFSTSVEVEGEVEVEEGWSEGDIPRATLHRYLDAVFDSPNAPDTLILGCTHFPVFSGLLGDILGDSVTLINSGEAASRHLAPYLSVEFGQPPRKPEFLVTDDPARFAENAAKFFDHSLSLTYRLICTNTATCPLSPFSVHLSVIS